MGLKTSPECLDPGTWIGPYRVIRIIGAGGGSRVYLVVREGRLYALKLGMRDPELPEESHEQDAERLFREFMVLRRMKHPNLVRTYGCDWYPNAEDGMPYLVMEAVDGEAFLDWISVARPPLRRVVEALARVASALEALHAAGICHRDVKSENILVTSRGHPTLIDLGIAQLAGFDPITGGWLIGTPTHLTPEALAHHDRDTGERFCATPAGDLYGMGYLLYQVLTGRRPYRSSHHDMLDLMVEIQGVVPPHPREVNPRAPVGLATLAMQLLSKTPEQRPGGLADALAGLLAHDGLDAPLETPPPPPRDEDSPTSTSLSARTYRKIFGELPLSGVALEPGISGGPRSPGSRRRSPV